MDKKGVLSWPNPTAEKVFFLCNRGEPPGKSVYRSTEGVETIPETDEDTEAKKITNHKTRSAGPRRYHHSFTPVQS